MAGMRLNRGSRLTLATLVALAASGFAQGASAQPAAGAPVAVFESTLDLATDEEGPPDTNAPFDLFTEQRFVYPYTVRDRLTGRQSMVRYRTLNLENEHLRVVVLPDLGGHIYSVVDKANQAEMFYANRSIRKAQVAYRGAWAAFGVEYNFPVSHSWVSLSPVDFAICRNPDGSASIHLGNLDRPYGMQWRVELRLSPGSALLEQRVSLYNPSPVRRRFYWWANAAVRVWDDSRICYPMRFTASHWFREVDTWPVNSAGVDLSRVGNHVRGAISLFAHASREPFMGVYHPRTRAGVVHYSSSLDAPAKKIWSWGGDADGIDWRKALSDDRSAYVEIQAGLFRDQETFAFLEPQETIRFTEAWMPVREIGGISRANLEGVLNLERTVTPSGAIGLTVGLNINRTLAGGQLRVLDGDRVVTVQAIDLTPKEAFRNAWKGLPAEKRYTVEVRDASGRVLMAHTEDVLDTLSASEVRVGPQVVRAPLAPAERTEGDFIELGTRHELFGKLLSAHAIYADGLARFPSSLSLRKAAGRLAVTLQRYSEAVPQLLSVLERVTNDPEAHYYLGLAQAALGNEAKARESFDRALPFRSFRVASRLELARCWARQGELGRALADVESAIGESPDSVRAGVLEVTLLRRLGRSAEAQARLAHWQSVDPTSTPLRYQASKLGARDEALWMHLASDTERVLDLAGELLGLGFWDEALELLSRSYPAVAVVEPGAVRPEAHPLLAYYRAYCRKKAGEDPRLDLETASGLPTAYVFPHRSDSHQVLRWVLDERPDDATARYLLGSLLLNGGQAEEAIGEWQTLRRSTRAIPGLHRNLGQTLLLARGDAAGALEVFEEGMTVDSYNEALYQGADQAHGLLDHPARERARTLAQYPDTQRMPPGLVQKLALALAETGRGEEAERLFAGRFFPREEFGTDIRQVFLEVRLRQAAGLAKAGKCGNAVRRLESFAQPVTGLAFSRDGMEAFVNAARMQYQIGTIWADCGQAAKARQHFGEAAKGEDQSFLGSAYAALAARRLGSVDPAQERKRLEEGLAASIVFLDQGTNFTGIVLHAQGLMLRLLGREEEAREKLREALRRPDQRLSHFLSRRALQLRDPL